MQVPTEVEVPELRRAVPGRLGGDRSLWIFDADPLAFRFYLLTLTAPSFGAVHRVPKRERARVRRCGCGVLHSVADAELRGVPLDVVGYDYAGAVAWNRDSGVLWDNTRRRLRDHFAGVEFFVVRECQDRGALHLHALVRIPIAGAPTDRGLGELALSAVAFSKIDGSEVAWGSQFQYEAFRADGAGARAIWYLSKALKLCAEGHRAGGGWFGVVAARGAVAGRGVGDALLPGMRVGVVREPGASAIRGARACGVEHAPDEDARGMVDDRAKAACSTARAGSVVLGSRGGAAGGNCS